MMNFMIVWCTNLYHWGCCCTVCWVLQDTIQDVLQRRVDMPQSWYFGGICNSCAANCGHLCQEMFVMHTFCQPTMRETVWKICHFVRHLGLIVLILFCTPVKTHILFVVSRYFNKPESFSSSWFSCWRVTIITSSKKQCLLVSIKEHFYVISD